jgi:medium-chain acyl-[acyl-carrier-protein] hydrolase
MDKYTIHHHEANVRKEATLAALLNLMQESAMQSAADFGVGVELLAERGIAWVLSRIYIDILDYPKVGDEILVHTFPVELGRFLTQRDYFLYHNNQNFLKATSQWLVFNLEKRSLVSIPSDFRAIDLPKFEEAFAPLETKLKAPTQVDLERHFVVGFHQIDFNQHTNNVIYVQWIMESVPEETLWTQQIKSIDIAFKGESRYNESVTVQTQIIDKQHFIHKIIATESGKELVLAETKWGFTNL